MSTIVAISTAPGVGGIGIIRMSGEKCFEILDKVFKPKNKDKNIKGYTIKYGHIVDENKIIDEVLVSYFVAPKSYTAENMCEINSHGGIVIMNKILDLCIKNGAKIAEAGEFTKRAFLNGRIDLSQAEAVIDIINSKTDKEAEVSVNQLNGLLSDTIGQIRKEILDLMANIEVSIDYPEYDVPEVSEAEINKVLESVKLKLKKLERSFEEGKILRDGISVAIIGRPNAGKSSLLNVILNEERAIVTNIEGTTRDTIEEFITIKGIPLKIIDTAGIRQTKDEIEKIGVNKSLDLAKKSDIAIGIFDISKKLTKEDYEILEILKNKNSIIVLNKNDLESEIENEEIKKINKPIIKISTKKREGIENLYEEIANIFKLNEIAKSGEIVISNIRHKQIILNALKSILRAQNSVDNNLPIDMISSDIKQILEELGEITGETVTEDIIKEIFSKFCLGK